MESLYNQQDNHSLNVKGIYRKIIRYWHYYLITAVILGGIAALYLKFTEPMYLVSTSLLVQNIEGNSETQLILKEIYPETGAKNLENEIGLIQSYSLIHETVKALDLEVSYFMEGMFGSRELYHSAPFWLQIDTIAFQLRSIPIHIQLLSDEKFKITIDEMDYLQIFSFGEECNSEYFKFKVFKSFDELPQERDIYYITINDIEELTEAYRKNLVINRIGSESTFLQLSLQGTQPKKEINFLNKLCEVYTNRNLEEKNQTATLTIGFINSQLLEVSDSLKGAENQLESFKSQENVMDISLTAVNASTKLGGLETQEADLNIKLKYYDYLLKYLQDSTDINSIIAPSSVGIIDPFLSDLIIELKRLNNERVAINYTRTTKSNELELLNLQIANARQTLIENVSNIIESSKIALREVNSRLAEVRRVVGKLPENERDLMRIQRKFNLSDNLYNYLLQKRAEAGISRASNLPDHKIVDHARIVGGEPISPKTSLVYILTTVLSLIFPTLLILVKLSLTDKIIDIDQIEKLTSIPISGKITHTKRGGAITELPKSILAESFRTLRINLQYFSLNKQPRVVGVTSTVNSEGKSFCAFNLANTLALAQKKVILIETDLRKPNLIQYYKKLSYQYGLSNYLIDHVEWQDIVQPTHINNLSIISGGPVPPNPLELMETNNFSTLINELKQHYDYVIIDSPPSGLVADYMMIMKTVDITLYVVRMDYSKTYFMSDLEQAFQQGKFNNISLVINDIKKHNSDDYRYRQYYIQNGKGNVLSKKIRSKYKSVVKTV